MANWGEYLNGRNAAKIKRSNIETSVSELLLDCIHINSLAPQLNCVSVSE